MTLRQRKMMQWLQASRQRTNWQRLTSSEPSTPSERATSSEPHRPSDERASSSPFAPRSSIATVIALCLLLTSCASTMPFKAPPKPERAKPASAMVECRAPAPMKDGTLASVVAKLLESLDLLAECSAKQRELTDWIGG